MKKIAVIGSTNVDLITYGDRVAKSGETLEAEAFAIGNGGKGANQAVAAAKLGAQVLMVSKVGDDQFAEMSLANYRSQHINTCFVTKVNGVSTGVAPIFVNTTTSQNSILIVKGANNYLKPADIDCAEAELKNVDMIVLQLEVPLETVYHAIDFGNKHNITVLLNPAPAVPELSLEYVCKCDFFVPNETELEILTGKPVATIAEINQAANVLFEHGLKNLIVTMGSRGSLWISKAGEYLANPIKVNAVDTSGAGDAFIGCFSHFFTQTGDVALALEKATIFAGLSVTEKGTQLSYPSLEKFTAYQANNL
ncbi:ribokinase [Photobacterium kishitanii]|uniref:Ribokinase n=1 Tax=Photobacterium kishitanii TaxID=318456 RepID=A0A0B7JEC8_9GAMM|nr:ribokinase [Photobacterium kishitanii]OBU23916.1 ribokinase [Photobacterium kishitanii]PSU89519.1 ribokinase [Photobacterium kishitanii]PSU89616.1 ribokinase [Photobacterium kishitanii]PSU93443.1 ribokinase [Photobacterium kishitanii]PSV22297.1 ribokinase [Photobacterium kishitanii]